MPGYDSQVIMAAGAFIQGSSIELSADGPLKEPYAVYFQGGLTWYHAKYGIMMALEKLVQAGIVTLSEISVCQSRNCRLLTYGFVNIRKFLLYFKKEL